MSQTRVQPRPEFDYSHKELSSDVEARIDLFINNNCQHKAQTSLSKYLAFREKSTITTERTAYSTVQSTRGLNVWGCQRDIMQLHLIPEGVRTQTVPVL